VGYIPNLTDEILELVVKYPNQYTLKAFDLEGVKLDLFNSYRAFLNQEETERPTNQTFIETIKPFLVFYKGLTDFAKSTSRISKEAIAVRNAISDSKEPERTFFEEFPTALGFSLSKLQESDRVFHEYINKLQEAIREIRTSQEKLFERVEEFILDDLVGEKLEFEVYREKLQKRFKNLKRHLCLPHQKTFLLRLDSQLDERNLWLSSLGQAIIGKSLDKIRDTDEVQLYDNFKSIILELDSLSNLSQSGFNEEKENVLEIEMSAFGEKKQRKLVRLPKSKLVDADKLEDQILKSLSKDRITNIYALTNLLKKLLKE